ncbi:MAG: hypothetical protein CL946_13845, partial [Ectothiorhodospiraceae bacterium]|nr:hypothetical protein [Ectothiorhodospiraceae bacterium]
MDNFVKTLSRSYTGALASALALLILAGCATTDIPESPDDRLERIAELQQRLTVNPNNPEALRDLGIIYFQSSRFYLADSLLTESLKHESRDAKTRFYLGMAQESRGDTAEALETYIHYEDYSALTPYRNLMQGRYHALSQAVISNQFQTLLAREQELTQNDITENSIAVFPLQYNAQNPEYATLGPALSEMIIIDLGQVGRLRPLERIRIRALLNELEFAESPMVDASSAPRMGKLLSSNHIVSGSYGVSGEENFRMDVADYDALKAEQSATISESDELANIFKAQKQVVFALVNEIGIELTPLERERIERVPTNNLQAFILYSIGLEKEDALDYRAALVYYNQSSELD